LVGTPGRKIEVGCRKSRDLGDVFFSPGHKIGHTRLKWPKWTCCCAPHSWTKEEINARNENKKFVKLTGSTYVCNSFTNIEYQVHAMTGNGNQMNLQKLGWKIFVKSDQVFLFLAGFNYLFETTVRTTTATLPTTDKFPPDHVPDFT
jgi:hypothetical protein